VNRVVVTGVGCVTPVGIGAAAFRESLLASRQGFSEIPGIAVGDLRFTRAARISDFDPTQGLTPSQLQLSERSSQFALLAAREAMRQSGLLATHDPGDVAVVFGCSTGGRSVEEAETAKLYLHQARVHPFTVPRVMASSGTSLVSMEHGLTGPTYTVSTACASATHAIGQAFHMVRSGMVSAALTGGHEAPLTYGFLKAWDSMRVVSPTQCRPFSHDRDGMTLSEGSAMLVLETLDSAMARGAEIFGEIAGFGMSSDAHHMTQAKPEGPIAAMTRALKDCGDLRAPITYINAHGTGTSVNDSVEAAAIREFFGQEAGTIAISSTKSMHGHAMGASGAMEALATLFALQDGVLPVNAGVETADTALKIDAIVGSPRKASVQMALSNSFAFGGLNAVLAFKPFGGRA
jgi:3-oxoacyl-[acyl-carrier-protein] synthase II/nodulation protein E